MSIILTNSIEEVRQNIKAYKEGKYTIGLVPTMGALHAGHASLIKKAKEMCDKVVVSVFVNPIQFGPNEDYEKYPRTIEQDKKVCEEIGADIIFAPTPKEMYGDKKLSNDEITYVCPPYNLVDCLCGKSRIGHFDGVATVVLKLFNIVQPDFAFFGQKDAQQQFIIRQMVKDLNVNVEIVSCPIVRESDGLALSSRNSYLSKEDRENALSISKALNQIEKLYKSGITDTEILFDAGFDVLKDNVYLEYIEFRDYENFEKVKTAGKNTLVAIAAKAGKTRLIDNIIL